MNMPHSLFCLLESKKAHSSQPPTRHNSHYKSSSPLQQSLYQRHHGSEGGDRHLLPEGKPFAAAGWGHLGPGVAAAMLLCSIASI